MIQSGEDAKNIKKKRRRRGYLIFSLTGLTRPKHLRPNKRMVSPNPTLFTAENAVKNANLETYCIRSLILESSLDD